MVAVFSIFATLSMLDFKQMGVGLAVAVLIDATIVRAVLLPATMKLLGDWNWYLPSWLTWHLAGSPSPRVHLRRSAPSPATRAAASFRAPAAVEVSSGTHPSYLTIQPSSTPADGLPVT